jgi:hypothetical protein
MRVLLDMGLPRRSVGDLAALGFELVSRVLPALFKATVADLAAGAMVSVSETTTRLRRLPLV